MKELASVDADFGVSVVVEGSRPRRDRCEGVSGMSVIWSLDLRVGKKSGKRGSKA